MFNSKKSKHKSTRTYSLRWFEVSFELDFFCDLLFVICNFNDLFLLEKTLISRSSNLTSNISNLKSQSPPPKTLVVF